MHSYKTLAVLALAASAASPAFSAPVLEGQQEARANVDERASALPSGIGQDVGSLLKTIGTNLAFGALPVALEHFLNSTRRGLPGDAPLATGRIVFDHRPVDIHGPETSSADNDKRAPGVGTLFSDLLKSFKTSDSIGSILKGGVISGLASGAGAVGAGELLNNTRREPSPLAASDFSGLAKTLAGALASLAAADGVKDVFSRDDVSPQDVIDVLRLLGRQLEELD